MRTDEGRGREEMEKEGDVDAGEEMRWILRLETNKKTSNHVTTVKKKNKKLD